MERKLQLLDSFDARGADGATYRVHGYEHLVRDESMIAGGLDQWQSTGRAEYRLADGERVQLDGEGRMRIVRSGIELFTAERQASG